MNQPSDPADDPDAAEPRVEDEQAGLAAILNRQRDYMDRALDRAEFETLEDGSVAGSIPACPGVIAFADSLRDCERDLRSVLEDWLLLGLKLGHALPVIGEIDIDIGSS